MDNKIIGIHQPNFFPWLGYFVKIARSNTFILLDDVQFPKTGSSYVNRVSILNLGIEQYLTVDVKRLHGTWNINESLFHNSKWNKKIFNTLQSCYGRSPYYNEIRSLLLDEYLIEREYNNLAEFNSAIIIKISSLLELDTEFTFSSKYNLNLTSTQRLVFLIKAVEGNVYLSGEGGDNYQELEIFNESGIKVEYNKFVYLTYTQFNSIDKLVKGLSILDLLFNLGIKESSALIKEIK